MMNDDGAIERLQASEELNRRILEAVPGGVVHVASDGSILRGNAEGLRILGLSFDELTERYTRDFDPVTIWEDGSHCPVEAYPVTQALVTGAPAGPTTIGIRRPDGNLSWAVFRAVPLKDASGAVTGVVATFLDITERRALEEKVRHSQRLESLGLLAGGIAHDFNNLLTIMLAGASLAQAELGPEAPAARYIAQLEEAALRATGLTRQMLAYSGKAHLRTEPIDLRVLVREILALLKTGLPKHVAITVQAPPRLPLIQADPAQLHQVLVNLITNAAEALGDAPGPIRVHIDAVTLKAPPEDAVLDDPIRPGAYLRLEVSDDGRGMDEATRARVFEPFFTTRASGRGLGLATTLGIVRGHRGAVAVRSALGVGTTFSIYLPASDTVVTEQRPRTILVVDDEAQVREVIAQVLKHGGYAVQLAAGGREALERIRGGGIGAVLLDCSMPDMSGAEVLQRLRATHADLPVLMMSGYTDADLDGANFIAKPFRAQELLSAVGALGLD